MTGRWQYRLRGGAEEPLTRDARKIGLPPQHPTLPSLLRDAGYVTTLIGKWHLGYPPEFGPLRSGYDHFFGSLGGAIDYFSHIDPSSRHDLWNGERPVHSDQYVTDPLSDQAVEFVRHQRPGRPFLLSLHYNAPHWPWLTRDDREESRRIGARAAHTDGGSITNFQRMVHHMDEGIGHLLHALRERGLEDQTLLIFTSDNGGERFSNHWPLAGQKMVLLEGVFGCRSSRAGPGASRRAASVPALT